MTTAPKIDTTAPRIGTTTGIDFGTGKDATMLTLMIDGKVDHACADGPWGQAILALLAERDLADARAAAAWQAAIGALLDEVGGLPISEIAADEVIYAAKLLQPPADTQAALDRLIAERVREAVDKALRDAVAICKKARNEAETDEEAIGALNCALAIMDEVNARSSKEGQS